MQIMCKYILHYIGSAELSVSQ